MAGPSSPSAEQAAAAAKAAADAAAQEKQRAQETERAQAARAAALQRAAATKEWDAAAAKIQAALDRAAAARAEAGAPTPPPQEQKDGGSPHLQHHDFHSAMMLHEAAAVLNLHAQAVSIQNIRSLITTILDVNSGNYARCRDQFLLTTGKFSLQDHVLVDARAPASPDWARMDCVVQSWITGTLSDDLAEAISSRGATARDLWVAVETHFLGNRETRTILLDVEFHGFSQGDLSIADYCRRFKKMADQLDDLGSPVSDRTLVLNVLRGLNERFTSIGVHLRRARPFPTFKEAQAELLLEEMNMARQSSSAPPAAFVASSTPKQVAPSGGTGSGGAGSSTPSTPGSKPKNRRSKRGGGNGGNNSANTRAPDAAAPSGGQAASAKSVASPWPSFWNPWTRSIQMWPGPRPPLAPLPPRPQQAMLVQPNQQQQAMLAQQLQQAQYQQAPGSAQDSSSQWGAPQGFYNPLAGTPSWDQQSLASTFSTMTLHQPQPSNEWYFDSGATSHMTSQSDILSHTFPMRYPTPSSIIVGNGSLLPVTATGTTVIHPSLHLNNVLVSPQLIKNLISVR